MSNEEKLSLTFLDVYGQRLEGRVDVHLEHRRLSSASGVVRNKKASYRMIIPNLALGVYKVSVYPTLYRPVKRFTMIAAGHVNRELITFPIDPDKVTGITAPEYAMLPDDLKRVLEESNIESQPDLKGEALYFALDDTRKAGLLNIYHKMRMTVFQSGGDAFSFVSSFTRIRGDRFFAHVKKDFRDEVKNSLSYKLFNSAPNLDHTPPPGYLKAGSFKTPDRYGNLQLTFFCKDDDVEFIVDADIDDAAGILHTFQVIEHYLTREGTHPYDIHEILLAHQKIDPGYKLVV